MKHTSAMLLLLPLALSSSMSAAFAADIPVDNAEALRDAISGASPGDVITLAPGTYPVTGKIVCRADGGEQGITVRAGALGDALIEFDAVEGFHVVAPGWTFENLDIKGVCANDSTCEHAFHITGRAHRTVVRGSRLHEFNAMIKGNGDVIDGTRVWPNDVLIEATEFFSASPRETSNPVTPIDIVGGRRWIIRDNFIHDHAKGGGNQISYAAFLKGHSKEGLFERNLVVCELLHAGQVRLGLSFGGGGSGPPEICEEGTCTPEHDNGVMRNNVIINCPSDVGIYLNAARNTQIFNNTLINTTGIDVRFDASVADLRNNLLTGRIRSRDGGTVDASDNLEMLSEDDVRRLFVDADALNLEIADGADIIDRGGPAPGVVDDFCRNPRDRPLDIGAIEYSGGAVCDTSQRPPPDTDEPDAGITDTDEPDSPDTNTDADADAPTTPDAEFDADEPDSGDALDAQENDDDNNDSNNDSNDDTSPDPSPTQDDGCACSTPSQSPSDLPLGLLMLGCGLAVTRRSSRTRR